MDTKTIVSLFMVFTMIGVVGAFPAVAQEITASAYGSAESGHHGSVSAMTNAYVSYTGELTSGVAGAGSEAQGREVYSTSSAGGYVIGWQAADIGTYAKAQGSDVSAYGTTGAHTLGWVPVEMVTSVSVTADAESGGHCCHGGSVEVGTEVGTIVGMNLGGTPGIQSNGFAGASATGRHGSAVIDGVSIARGSDDVVVSAGANAVSPGVHYEVELNNWAYAGILPMLV